MSPSRTSRPPAPTRSARGRRGSRPSGDDRELAILGTAERLLAERPFAEISIDDLARGAGISRPTFYFYFPSKDAVLLALLDRVMAEADRLAFGGGPGAAGLPELSAEGASADPAALWRAGIGTFVEVFGAHRPVSLAAASVKAGNAEVAELWSRMMDKWVRHTEEIITFERARGAAPDGPPARELAVALNLMNERVLCAVFAGERPSVAEEHVVDTLLHIWLNTIYQPTATPPPVG